MQYVAQGERYEALEEKLEKTRLSTTEFCKFFMPDHFRHAFNRAHYMMAEALDDTSIQKVNIVGCRGLGKTSIVVKGYIGRNVAWRHIHHVVYGSKSEDIAVQKTENLKLELMRNKRIQAIFPSIKVTGYKDDFTEKFSQTAWVAFGDVCVRSQGMKQAFRGLNYDRWRPEIVMLDDTQEMKEIQNAELRDEQFKHLRGDVEECVDQWEGSWFKIVHADTCKHEDGLTERLESLPDWTTIRIPAAHYDEEKKVYITLYPDMLSQKRLDEKVESARIGGTLDVFARETLARPSAVEDQAFQKKDFHYYSEHDRKFITGLPIMDTVILIDPAKAGRKAVANPKACDTAIGVISVDRWSPAIYYREVIADRFDPNEIVDLVLELEQKFDVHIIGNEVTGLGKWGMYPFETEYRRRGGRCQLVELHAKRGENEDGKTERIKQLIPFYRRGQVFHNPNAKSINKLEQQLLSFPTSKLWDCMDMAAYAVQVLSDTNLIFVPKQPTEMDYKAVEREYAAIERAYSVQQPSFEREW